MRWISMFTFETDLKNPVNQQMEINEHKINELIYIHKHSAVKSLTR